MVSDRSQQEDRPMTITPPPDDTDIPPIDTPPELPETQDPPLRAPGGDEPTSEPPSRLPTDNPNLEMEH
jgi:hypothetical protein